MSLDKSTRVLCHSHLPDEFRPALCLTDFGLMEIDSDDAPTLTLTPAAIAALDESSSQSMPLTPLLVKRLAEFKAAREAREQAPKGHLLTAIQAEDAAALNLAWAFEIAIDRGVQSC